MEQEEKTALDRAFVYWLDFITMAVGTYEGQGTQFTPNGPQPYMQIKLDGNPYGVFEYQLDKYYREFLTALEASLRNIHNKYDKLFRLANYEAEVAAAAVLITTDEFGKLHHRNFEFLYMMEQDPAQLPKFDENDYQHFYRLMDQSLRKMTAYLGTVRQNIVGMDQSDIPLPVVELENNKISTVEQPIAFFDWFYARGGLTVLREKFIDDAMEHYCSFNEIEDARICDEPVDDHSMETKEVKTFFADELKVQLIRELDLSHQLISNHIDQQQSFEAVRLRLQFLLSSLAYYLKLAQTYPLYQRFGICITAVNNLQQYIHGKYGSFLPSEAVSAKTVEIFEKKLDKPDALPFGEPPITSFAIQGKQPHAIIAKLWHQLTTNEFIDRNTPAETMLKAFNGLTLNEPLNIKWMVLSRNGQVNKRSLLYLFKRLSDEKILAKEPPGAHFLARVKMIFSDAKGQTLENLDVSSSELDKPDSSPPARSKEIDKIVKDISAILAEGLHLP